MHAHTHTHTFSRVIKSQTTVVFTKEHKEEALGKGQGFSCSFLSVYQITCYSRSELSMNRKGKEADRNYQQM